MKAAIITRFLLMIMTVGLLLSQVGAGFFHNKHDAHKETRLLGAGMSAIQEHGEHCKLCAIDLIHLYNERPQVSTVTATGDSIFLAIFPGAPASAHTFLKGRSPPVNS